MPFQVIGSPFIKGFPYTFTPQSIEGFEKNPLHKGENCNGLDLSKEEAPKGFSLKYVISLYMAYKEQGKAEDFFSRASWFDQLMGTSIVRQQIMAEKNEVEIRSYWHKELEHYREMRQKYVLY